MDRVVHTFGPFRLDEAEHVLLRGASVVPIAPRAFETLLALLKRAGRLVRRDELTRLVWPETFVSDATLSQNVWLVRRALGREGASMIETVPRIGYRFRFEVRRSREGGADPGSDNAPAPSRCWLIWGRRRFRLAEGANVLGRDPSADVVLDLATISRRHARIVVTRDEAVIEDLGSKNGVRVQGRLVEGKKNLANGDEIRVGSVQLAFRSSDPAASTKSDRG